MFRCFETRAQQSSDFYEGSFLPPGPSFQIEIGQKLYLTALKFRSRIPNVNGFLQKRHEPKKSRHVIRHGVGLAIRYQQFIISSTLPYLIPIPINFICGICELQSISVAEELHLKDGHPN